MLIRFWQLLLATTLIVKSVLGTYCYVCNSRDDLGCDDIDVFDLRYLKWCKSGICSVIKGQWANVNPFDRKYMLRRGCGPVKDCNQAHAICCSCDESGCNFYDKCIGEGHRISRTKWSIMLCILNALLVINTNLMGLH